MASKDVTRVFRFVLPLLSIFFIAAGSAYACPEHKTRAAYRTKAINTRTVSHMAPVVITYGGPASYQRCIDNQNGTRSVRYMAVRNQVPRKRFIVRDVDYDDAPRYVAVRRQQVYVDSAPRYVAVRNHVPSARHVVVRNLDYDVDARPYVTVRRLPVHDTATNYVAIRNAVPRTKYVAVRDIDYDDEPRYIAVRRQQAYVDTAPRYVAVRNYAPRTRYVDVNDIDYDDDAPAPRSIAVQNIDTDFEVETPRPRHVVVKTDLLAGTEEVLYSSPSDLDDTAYVAPPIENLDTTDVAYTPAAYTNGNGVYDVDVDDQADLYDNSVTYVAADDMEDSGLIDTSPELVTTRAVSYVPVDDVDDNVYTMGTDVTYVHDDDGFSIRYRPLFDDEDFGETAYIEADNLEETDVGTGIFRYVRDQDVDDVDAVTASSVPAEPVRYVLADVDDVDAMAARSVQVEPVSYMPVETVSYEPVRDTDTHAMYVLDDSDNDVDMIELDADECITIVSTLDGEPVQFTDTSSVLVNSGDDYMVADLNNGFEEDVDPLLERDILATSGHEDTFDETDEFLDSDLEEAGTLTVVESS